MVCIVTIATSLPRNDMRIHHALLLPLTATPNRTFSKTHTLAPHGGVIFDYHQNHHDVQLLLPTVYNQTRPRLIT